MQNNYSTKELLALIATFLIIGFTGCKKEDPVLVPATNITSSIHAFTGVDGLIVSDKFDVTIKISDTEEKVVIETNENLHDFIVLNQNSGTLTIATESNILDLDNVTLKATVFTHQISSFEARGLSRITSPDSIIQPTVWLKISDQSTFKAALYVDKLIGNVSGESSIDIKGTGSTIELEMTGVSFVNGFDFVTDRFTGDFKWESSANLTINQAIYLEAANASSLYFMGKGRIKEQNLMGGSFIQHIP